MTVCLGLVCGGGKYILLSADTRGSYGTASSNEEMAKLFPLPANYCAAVSGNGSQCTELIAEIAHRMAQIADSEIAPGQVRQCILDSYAEVYRSLADEALRRGPRITMDQYLHDKNIVTSIRNEARDAIKEVNVDAYLIVAGFYSENPVQFVVDGGTSVRITVEITPGNAVVGSGGQAALNWLNYRKQNCHFGLAHSLLHLTEAKQFAEVEPSVGSLRQIVLLRSGRREALDWNEDAQHLLQGWWKEYGLPLSDALDDGQYNKVVCDTFGIA
jgi:hypothetical protein